MAVVAAVAVALVAWFAAAAQGGTGVAGVDVPLAVLAAALIPGVALAARRPRTRVLPPGRDALVLCVVTVAGLGALYLADWTNVQHVAALARMLPLGMAALGVLWPEPAVLRYCLVLGVGSLLGAAAGTVVSGPAFGAALVALAVAMVATNRLTAARAPRLGATPGVPGRRVGAEAATVLVVAGVLAALAATLLPPPPGRGGPQQGNGRRSQPSPRAQPPLGGADRLDVGAARGRPNNAVVLRVAAAGPDLWRATTYDRWDGEAWQRSPDPVDALQPADGRGLGLDRSGRTLVPPGAGDIAGTGARDIAGTDADFVQRVTIEAASASILVGAARPVWVTVPAGGVVAGADATLRPRVALRKGDHYVVESERTQADPATLRAADRSVATADQASEVGDRYEQLPQLSPAVRSLAAQLTEGATTTYDRTRAVEIWLRDNTRVTETAVQVAPGTDPVEAFVTDRAGPAERSATAMAVMLRSLGIPARLAVGFLPGRRSGLSGEFVVRGRDAHAWVEVWFAGVGWQRFDPTGLAPTPGARDDSLWARLKRLARQLWPLVAFVLLVVAVGVAWVVLRRRRRRAAQPWVSRFFGRLERAGQARGRPRRPPETPAEYAAELAASVLPDPRLVEVGELVTAAAWSRREPAAEDRARAEAVLRQASRAAPVRRLRRRSRPRPVARPTIPEP